MRIVLQAVICISLIVASGTVDGQDQATGKLRLDKTEMKRWVEFYQAEAKQYDIFLDEDRTVKLTFKPEPVFRWSSPNANNEFNGVMFVWHHQGRPEVIGSIWSIAKSPSPGKRTICHTFHSLAAGPLHAERKGEPWWHPRTAGVAPKLIPGAPVPAKSAQFRLTQMRALAREFSVSQYMDRAETRKETLRLLPKPIYRFEHDSEDAFDVGIFAYLRGWDAEILVMIETRDTPDGPRWHYAPVRFCALSARVEHKGKQVWTYERGGPLRDRQHYYLSIHGASIVDRYFDNVEEESP